MNTFFYGLVTHARKINFNSVDLQLLVPFEVFLWAQKRKSCFHKVFSKHAMTFFLFSVLCQSHRHIASFFPQFLFHCELYLTSFKAHRSALPQPHGRTRSLSFSLATSLISLVTLVTLAALTNLLALIVLTCVASPNGVSGQGDGTVLTGVGYVKVCAEGLLILSLLHVSWE